MHAKRQGWEKLEGMATHLSGVAFVVDEDHTELEQRRIQSLLDHLVQRSTLGKIASTNSIEV